MALDALDPIEVYLIQYLKNIKLSLIVLYESIHLDTKGKYYHGYTTYYLSYFEA